MDLESKAVFTDGGPYPRRLPSPPGVAGEEVKSELDDCICERAESEARLSVPGGKEIFDSEACPWDGMLSNIVLREPSTMCRGSERCMPCCSIVAVVGCEISNPRCRKSRMSRHARMSGNITLSGIRIADITAFGLMIL